MFSSKFKIIRFHSRFGKNTLALTLGRPKVVFWHFGRNSRPQFQQEDFLFYWSISVLQKCHLSAEMLTFGRNTLFLLAFWWTFCYKSYLKFGRKSVFCRNTIFCDGLFRLLAERQKLSFGRPLALTYDKVNPCYCQKCPELFFFTCGGARRSISGTFSSSLDIESLLRDTA